MSALGHKRTFAAQNGMSALPPIENGSRSRQAEAASRARRASEEQLIDNASFTAQRGDDAVNGFLLVLRVGGFVRRKRRPVHNNPNAERSRQHDKDNTTTLLGALSMAARASAKRRSGVVLLRQLSVAAEYFGHVAQSRFEARRLVPISMRSTLTSSAAARRSAARLCRRLRSRSGPRSASRALRLAFLCFLMSGEESERQGMGAARARNTVPHTPPRPHTSL
jgi:hypothetical protein